MKMRFRSLMYQVSITVWRICATILFLLCIVSESAAQGRPRPVKRTCPVTAEDTQRANRWSATPGYEYMAGRGDLVCRWLAENLTVPIDPAVWLWKRGYDAPVLDCSYKQWVERDASHLGWNKVYFKLKKMVNVIEVDPYAERFEIRTTFPCYKGVITSGWYGESEPFSVEVKSVENIP